MACQSPRSSPTLDPARSRSNPRRRDDWDPRRRSGVRQAHVTPPHSCIRAKQHCLQRSRSARGTSLDCRRHGTPARRRVASDSRYGAPSAQGSGVQVVKTVCGVDLFTCTAVRSPACGGVRADGKFAHWCSCSPACSCRRAWRAVLLCRCASAVDRRRRSLTSSSLGYRVSRIWSPSPGRPTAPSRSAMTGRRCCPGRTAAAVAERSGVRWPHRSRRCNSRSPRATVMTGSRSKVRSRMRTAS